MHDESVDLCNAEEAAQQSQEEVSLKKQLMDLMREMTAERAGDDAHLAVRAGKPGERPQADDALSVHFQELDTAPPGAGSKYFANDAAPFIPREPESLAHAGLSESEVEALILKFLLNCGSVTGHVIADQLRLPFKVIKGLLAQMKLERLVVYRSDATMNDYLHELTEHGNDRARRHAQRCTYFGAAPVTLSDYVDSVSAQTLNRQKPSRADLQRAFDELLLSDELFSQLGQALHAGRGLFLYGAPGNGKTCIAQRVTAAYSETIWIPRCVSVFGEIVRLYDPSTHVERPLPPSSTLIKDRAIDHRWVRIRRPTIVVGGELTMENLEIKTNSQTGICEAPLQMKSNGGTLVIDDFGRQRISTDELLNRWIVPLETGYDFLNLASGRKIKVPFDQLIVFSTNLEPTDLVDEAFLRRIPYKLEVDDPSENQFRALFAMMAGKMGISCSQELIDYLLENHFRKAGRPLRFCHARDLLRQILNFCSFHETERAVTRENLDAAVKNYFSALEVDR